ncbi:MAG: acyl-CoA dehydrogenase family protein [Phyllobacteriaceae bacterium]|nr:acyl-CoA dehydrogenase family protein [Phyllobacteriaceae bacterium]
MHHALHRFSIRIAGIAEFAVGITVDFLHQHGKREGLAQFGDHGFLGVVVLAQEGLWRFEPSVRHVKIHGTHFDSISDVLDGAAGEARFALLDGVKICAKFGQRIGRAMSGHMALNHLHQFRLLRRVMFRVSLRHCRFDILCRIKRMFTERDLVVLARQQRQNINVIIARLWPVHLPAPARPLAQRVIDRAIQIFGGEGVRVGSKVEELYREVRALRIYEGATEVQKVIIARALLSGPGS